MIPEKLPSARPRKARREALKAHIWGLLQQLDVEKQEPQETWQTFFWCEDCTCWEEHVSTRAAVSSMTVEAVECLSMFYIRSFTMLCTVDTSSTAQGGGGSFKNRKPIGEIGCCESEMAERSHCWTERRLISLTLSLTIYLPTYLSI